MLSAHRPFERRETTRARRGFVLVAAVLALVLIAALAAAVLFTTGEETRAGSVGIKRAHALVACESALATAITGAGIQLPSSIGVSGTTSSRVDSDGWEVVVYVTRLDSAIYWIVADVTPASSGSAARKRVGVFVRAVARDDHSITIDPISEQAWAELF
jgi:type II secretory pathway pseudopilin PulG